MGRPAAGGRADYPPEPRLYFPKSERVGAGVQPNWGYYSNASRAKRRREPGLPDSSDDTQNDPHEQDFWAALLLLARWVAATGTANVGSVGPTLCANIPETLRPLKLV